MERKSNSFRRLNGNRSLREVLEQEKNCMLLVMKYAHQNNFKRVAWEVLDWNTNAIDFYKKTGATVYDEWRVCHMNEHKLKRIL